MQGHWIRAVRFDFITRNICMSLKSSFEWVRAMVTIDILLCPHGKSDVSQVGSCHDQRRYENAMVIYSDLRRHR